MPRLRMTVMRSLAAILPLRFLSYNEKHSLNSANEGDKTNGEHFPVHSQQMCPFYKAASSVISETAEMMKFRPNLT